MAKCIMVQGTMSNAGKSFVAAALCRIFRQDGYRVAPFKSQNMALNSFVTEEGLEMGRAQVVQAEAAGVRPEVAMNPVLLKPVSHMGSQVIVNGEIRGNYTAAEYYRLKKTLVPEIRKALDKLGREYDIIVIEGAGSPAEINLKENDIVNMGIAKMAGAPVILVGDIDRGGVFASLYGTVKLLEEEEQAMIKGIVINKFRGDKKLLEPGLRMIEEKVEIPVIGVIPMGNVDIEEEDSLAERLNRKEKGEGADLAVIRLPHISNFTDFSVLEQTEGLSLRYVSCKEELGRPEGILLPGTKNTMADLKWLKENGLADGVKQAALEGIPVIGICGGFQMLGTRLTDAYGVEEAGEQEGLGLLEAETAFSREKVRTQEKTRILCGMPGWEELSGLDIEGYEIHMGQTKCLGGCQLLLEPGKEAAAVTGLCRQDGNVWGTYLHGFFDGPGVADAFAAAIRRKSGERKAARAGKGYGEKAAVSEERQAWEAAETEGGPAWQKAHRKSWSDYREEQYDKLAELVRGSLDMEMIYRILKEGIGRKEKET